ncbi:hypothetical protein [Vibrio owensii]|uniref:hypothetical protein n=1 Tax=Vibrio owensii TaxID=696485 RepID=UPI0018F21719|nr:hypothetical protein [Vibrio owensii]
MENAYFSAEQITNLLTANAAIMGLAFGIVAALFIRHHWFAFSLRIIRFRHNFPLIGKIARIRKNDTYADGWFLSEIEVAQDFKNHYHQVNGDVRHYNNCVNYLDIAGEAGRKPISIGILAILLAVLCIEALGFTYTMAGFVDISASENTRQVIAVVTAITFAVALTTVTHKMGHEMHRNTILANIRRHWENDDLRSKHLTQEIGPNLSGIDSPTDIDDKPYQRRLNRLKLGSSKKRYFWTSFTIATIAIIATTLTYIRLKAFESSQGSINACNTASGANYDALYEQTEAVQTISCEAATHGGWATFFAMALLFCLLQVFTTWIAKSRGFASAQGSKAYQFVKDYNNRKHYCDVIKYRKELVADMAQYSLSKLQQKMARTHAEQSTQATVIHLLGSANERTFKAFILRSQTDFLDNPIFEGCNLEDKASAEEQIQIEKILDKRIKAFLDEDELNSRAEIIRSKRELLTQIDYRFSYEKAIREEQAMTGNSTDLYETQLELKTPKYSRQGNDDKASWRSAVANGLRR